VRLDDRGAAVGVRDESGFDEFYRATSARLLRFAYAVAGDLTEAQDLVQDAYVRAWQHWRTVAGHPNPEGWLRLVLTRRAADRWRRIARRTALLRNAGPPQAIPPPNEDTVVLVAALRQLPLAHRQALALHYLFDQPVAQVAEEVGVPIGTVKSWLSRGRAGLAEALTGSPAGGSPGGSTDD
jgi:RNA polymerase sigma-70 factor (ECF subfamily)